MTSRRSNSASDQSRSRTYQFLGSSLTIRFGDITSSDAQAVVSSDDCYITMGGGVSMAILRAGGEAIAVDAAKKVPAAVGDIVVTTAGALAAQYVFHAITIGATPGELSDRQIVEQATRRCMQLVDAMQLSSIAFPAIGAGVAGFPYDEVAACMAEVISEELLHKSRSVAVSIFLFDRFGSMDDWEFLRFFEEFAARVPRLTKHSETAATTAATPRPTIIDLATETADEYKRRRLHNLRKLLAVLEDRRAHLESGLIAALENDKTAEAAIRLSLRENEDLRLQYLGEVRSLAAEDGLAANAIRPKNLTVFLSSTWRDLLSYRSTVKEVLQELDLLFRGMEHFGASPERLPPAKLIIEEVKKADVYLGVFGVRYGSIDTATGLSMTELEFREAETSGKKMLLYVIHEEAPVIVSQIETSFEGQSKLAALKVDLLNRCQVYLFKSVDDLRQQVYVDLSKLREGATVG